MGKVTMIKRDSRQWRKLQSGQSLAEVAVSLTVLIIMFSGAIDLGRAFFTKITLDSAISEGAHWMAAYPGCVAYGAAFGDASNVVNADPRCKGTNSITQRIKNESTLLDPNNIVSVSLTLPPTITMPSQITPGVTLTMKITYKMPVVTPVIQAMFGPTVEIVSQAQEVVRGATKPGTTGQSTSYTPISPVPMVPKTSLVQELYGIGEARCQDGYVSLKWNEPASGITPLTGGYEVWLMNAGSGEKVTQIDDKVASGPNTPIYSLVPGSPNTQINITTDGGGNLLYGVRAYNKTGSPPTKQYSDFQYILASCAQVQPTLESFTCVPALPSTPTSVTFKWSMPSEVGWATGLPVDNLVYGYHLYKVDYATTPETVTLVQTFASRNVTGTLDFTAAVSPEDPNRTATYRLSAYQSDGTNVGLMSDAANDLSIDCSIPTP